MKYNLFVKIFLGILIFSIIVIIVVLIVNRPSPYPNTQGGPNSNISLPPSPQHPNGILYLMPEALGFDIPELIKSGLIMEQTVAQNHFDKVVVMANAAKYLDSKNAKIMTDQWDNKLVTALGLPVERWAFICCSSHLIPAKTRVDNLLANFPNIKGFLIDSEDDTIKAFAAVFNNLGKKYKYGIVGGLRHSIPPPSQYGMAFDIFFDEVYTEGHPSDEKFYEKGAMSTDGTALCMSMSKKAISNFWSGVNSLRTDVSIVPTVCGAGNCQELLYGDMCFDERLSSSNIGSLLKGNTSGRKDFAIWYGTGRNPECDLESKTCLELLSSTTCSTNTTCMWNSGKKNPTTNIQGVCVPETAPPAGNWGCAKDW